MEALLSIAKVIGLFFLTTLLNKVLSIFRPRSLYLSIDRLLDCHDAANEGYTATLTLYNKGTNKEENVEIFFPLTKNIQIISSDHYEAKVDEQTIKVDRILPKTTITLFVYLNGAKRISENRKPIIKSKDANGTSYFGSHVPVSKAYVTAAVSITLVMLALTTYSAISDNDLSYAYYKIRYPSLLKQGFTPASYSANRLISPVPLSEVPYPLEIIEPLIKSNSLITAIKIKNILDVEIVATLRRDRPREYISQVRKTFRLEKAEQELAQTALAHKYGIDRDQDYNSSEARLAPGQTKTLELETTVLMNTQLDDQIFDLSIDGQDKTGEEFIDVYKIDLGNYKKRELFDEKISILKSRLRD